ncbi:MAG TPA: hypothetical protein GX711_08605, partial [Clostridia bacterium]|nr:hypothetical protein [Clostridia bacterium]
NNYIHILGNGWFSGNPSNVALENVTIHGALFSITKGFGYEFYDTYEKGIITLRGSLIQKTREPVGQFNFWGDTGYDKDYAHDSRMLYSSPPHFLEPQNTGWELTGWKEIQ